MKKLILIDLDGVLNDYNGNYNAHKIPPIKEGAKDFITKLAQDYNLCLFTSRNILDATRWLIKNKIDKYFTEVTNTKRPAFLYIDDRAITFDGDFNKTTQEIKKFKTYWKK